MSDGYDISDQSYDAGDDGSYTDDSGFDTAADLGADEHGPDLTSPLADPGFDTATDPGAEADDQRPELTSPLDDADFTVTADPDGHFDMRQDPGGEHFDATAGPDARDGQFDMRDDLGGSDGQFDATADP